MDERKMKRCIQIEIKYGDQNRVMMSVYAFDQLGGLWPGMLSLVC